jgi:hypothetical protein
MTFNDVFYKDISVKGDPKLIWGFKFADYNKKMVYFKYDSNSDSKSTDYPFVKADQSETQSIQKSFLKRKKEKTKEFLEPHMLIGYIELKHPQKTMLFKIRDNTHVLGGTRKDGKVERTQIKTGIICKNDGMKKKKVIEFMIKLLDINTNLPYDDPKMLPNKDLLCIQLETFFRYFDKERHNGKRYFFNYEESIEHNLTIKKN